MTEEIIFKIKADTGNSAKTVESVTMEMENLNDVYNDVIKSNTNLSASFEEVYGDMRPLTTSISELEDRMYELAKTNQQGSQEFKDLQAEVVKYKQIIISVDKSVDQLAEQGRGLGAALQIGTTVVAGYGALQGGMALLGGESEQLQATFVKLQAVQTVLASLEQLKLSLDKQSLVVIKAKQIATATMTFVQTAWTTATTATTVATTMLGVAMMALPIIAIIAGIFALVKAVQFFTGSAETAEEANNKLNKSFEEGMEIYERSKDKYRRNAQDKMDIAKLEGATEEELHQMKLDNLRDEEAFRNKDAKKQLQQIQDKRVQYKKALQEGNDDVAKTIADEIKQHRTKYKDIRNLDGQYFNDKKKLELEERNRLAEEAKAERQEQVAENKRRAENWKKAQEEKTRKEQEDANKRLELSRTIEDLMNENIKDSTLRSLMIMQTSHKREREELIKKYGEDTTLLKQLEESQANEVLAFNDKLTEDKLKAESEANTKAIELKNKDRKAGLEYALKQAQEDFDMTQEVKAELALFEMEQELAQESLTANEKLLIQANYQEKLKVLADERKAHEVDVNEQIKQVTVQTYTQGLAAAQNLSDAFFDNKLAKAEKGSAAELAIEKKKFEVNKKLQIAQAIMQGIQGVQAAFSSGAAIPIVGAVTGPLFAALAGAASLLNINKIKNTKFDSSSASVSAPSISTPSIPSATDIVGGTDNNGTLTSGLTGSEQQSSGNTNIKVNVVDSEIKAVMDNSQQVKVISTIGG